MALNHPRVRDCHREDHDSKMRHLRWRDTLGSRQHDPEVSARLRFVAQGWSVKGEFVDHAPANDLNARKAWRDLFGQASRRRFDLLLIWRLDRAFRSVLDSATTLERLRAWGIGLRSYGEPWLDTTSPFGEALYYITAAYAQLERGILSERVKAGMARARKQGKRLGRPRAVNGEWARVQPLIRAGTLSQRAAARELGVGRSTIARMLAQ